MPTTFKPGRPPKPGPPYVIIPAGSKLDDHASDPTPLYTVDPRSFVEAGRTSWPGWLFVAIPPQSPATPCDLGLMIGSKIGRFRKEPVEAEKKARARAVHTLREKHSLREVSEITGLPRRTVLKEQRKKV